MIVLDGLDPAQRHAVTQELSPLRGVTIVTSAQERATDIAFRPLERLVCDLSPQLDIPTPTEVLQARRNAEARAQLLQEFGALSSAQVADLVGSEAKNRSSVAHRWRKEGRLLGVTYRGAQWFPGFQFKGGDVLPVVADVLAEFGGAEVSEWEVALWFTTSTGWLDDRRPVDVLLDDPQAVVDAARLEVAEFGG